MGQKESEGTNTTIMNGEDPTKIDIKWQSNLKKEFDPTVQRMSGHAYHGDTPFDVPFISQIDGNLWQGGCATGLKLPHFIKHVVSLYPWEQYKIEHNVRSQLSVMMYDSLEQSMDQVDAIANWINTCVKDGPTLVHCQAGLNRSGLVAARSLMLREDDWPKTYDAQEAIMLLRETRSPAVLCNPSFEEHLRSL